MLRSRRLGKDDGQDDDGQARTVGETTTARRDHDDHGRDHDGHGRDHDRHVEIDGQDHDGTAFRGVNLL